MKTQPSNNEVSVAENGLLCQVSQSAYLLLMQTTEFVLLTNCYCQPLLETHNCVS